MLTINFVSLEIRAVSCLSSLLNGLAGFKGGIYLLAVLVFSGLVSNAVSAVTISPVKVSLSPAHPVVTITVTNDADFPLTLQNQVLSWSQVDGEDRLEESTDLLVAPVIIQIAPKGTQIFRVTQRRKTPSITERAYRLVLDDISAIEHAGSVNGINFIFSHRLPVFIAGTGTTGAKPQFGVCVVVAKQPCVRLVNKGDHYVQVRSVLVKGSNWQVELGAGERILAGAWMQWTYDLPPVSAGKLTAIAKTSVGEISIELPTPELLPKGSVIYPPR